jgi:hypothetical protein
VGRATEVLDPRHVNAASLVDREAGLAASRMCGRGQSLELVRCLLLATARGRESEYRQRDP